MQNFIFNNAEIPTIDIIGSIGEGFFEDGVTIDNVLWQLNNIKSDEIILNISSLGGDVNHALAIHDALQMHKAKITARITGMTASSGTIIAMAADTVTMSENAFFLIHNVWSGINGNQHELRELADEMEKMDNVLASMYAKKTGKRKSQMLSLMKEERWLNAVEASEFGFIDKVFEPSKIAASVIKEINNSNLPNFKNSNKMKEHFEDLKNFLSDILKPKEVENIEEQEETVNNDAVVEFENKIKELEVAKSEELATAQNEFEAKMQEKEELFNAKVKEIEELNAKISEMEAELSKFNAPKSDVVAQGDPALSIEPIEETPLQKELKALTNAYKGRVIPNKK